MKYMPPFIEVGSVVFPMHAVAVDFRKEGQAVVIFQNNSFHFEGEDAAGLRRFFTPPEQEMPPATEPPAGQTSTAPEPPAPAQTPAPGDPDVADPSTKQQEGEQA
jgi:hypothetical protein